MQNLPAQNLSAQDLPVRNDTQPKLDMITVVSVAALITSCFGIWICAQDVIPYLIAMD